MRTKPMYAHAFGEAELIWMLDAILYGKRSIRFWYLVDVAWDHSPESRLLAKLQVTTISPNKFGIFLLELQVGR